jgi:hypothetical protein
MKWNSLKALTVAAIALLTSSLALAGPDLGEAQQQATNWHAIIMFGIFVGLLMMAYVIFGGMLATTTNELTAASVRTGFSAKRNDTTSDKLNLPKLRRRSATKNNTIGQPTMKPNEYSKPSKPELKTIAEIPKNDAADI